MLRELLKGLAVVLMASSVIISNIFRSTRSDKLQLPAKNISSSTSTTAGPDVPSPEPESGVLVWAGGAQSEDWVVHANRCLSRNQSYF